MRSVERAWRLAGVALLCAAAAGCASVTAPLQGLRQALGVPAAPPATAAPTSQLAAAPATPAAAPNPAQPEVAVAPATQAAFDDARRALAAGRTEQAEKAFRALAQAHPELGGPQANLGLIQRQAGKLPEAAAALERAVAASPSQPLYWNELGVTYRMLGRFKQAREAYEQALALDAAHAGATLNLAILNDLYLNDSARALALYERYLALTPAGDAKVGKWVADLKNRQARASASATKKEPS